MNEYSRFKWAVVTAVNPVRVKLDGDSSALDLTPNTLISPSSLAVNDRVRVEIYQRQIIIHGKAY